MLRKTLGEEGAARFLADDGSGAEPDAGEACRAACRAAFVDGLKNLARVLESREHAGEAFLAPDGTPDPSDFVLGGAVVVCIEEGAALVLSASFGSLPSRISAAITLRTSTARTISCARDGAHAENARARARSRAVRRRASA